MKYTSNKIDKYQCGIFPLPGYACYLRLQKITEKFNMFAENFRRKFPTPTYICRFLKRFLIRFDTVIYFVYRSICSRKKKEEESDEEKEKEHISKMDAKLLSFTTFYYVVSILYQFVFEIKIIPYIFHYKCHL